MSDNNSNYNNPDEIQNGLNSAKHAVQSGNNLKKGLQGKQKKKNKPNHSNNKQGNKANEDKKANQGDPNNEPNNNQDDNANHPDLSCDNENNNGLPEDNKRNKENKKNSGNRPDNRNGSNNDTENNHSGGKNNGRNDDSRQSNNNRKSDSGSSTGSSSGSSSGNGNNNLIDELHNMGHQSASKGVKDAGENVSKIAELIAASPVLLVVIPLVIIIFVFFATMGGIAYTFPSVFINNSGGTRDPETSLVEEDRAYKSASISNDTIFAPLDEVSLYATGGTGFFGSLFEKLKGYITKRSKEGVEIYHAYENDYIIDKPVFLGNADTGDVSDQMSQEEFDALYQNNDLVPVMKVMSNTIDTYLANEYDLTRLQIMELAEREGYDEELTLNSFNENINIFGNMNYASLVAAYSVYDTYNAPDYVRFKSMLHNAKWLSYDVEAAEKEVVTPTPVYKYNPVDVEVDYMAYLKDWGDGTMAVYEAQLDSLNTEIRQAEDKIAANSALEPVYTGGVRPGGTGELAITYVHTAAYYAAIAERDALVGKKNTLSGHPEASKVSEVKIYPQYKVVTLYQLEYGINDVPIVDDYVGEEYRDHGKVEPVYSDRITYMTDSTYLEYHKELYRRKGFEPVFPDVSMVPYGEVKLSAVDTTPEAALKLFGLDPNAPYHYSTKEAHSPTQITNLKQYNNYYDNLSIYTDLSAYKGASFGVFTSYGQTYTEEEIAAMIGNLPISGNRKELLKYALGLCGRVMYQWGGKSSELGYQTKWSSATSTGNTIGLDCSGFVQWAIHNAMPGDPVWKIMVGTSGITRYSTQISEADLVPGDMGTSELTGKHVGIFLGYDENGKALWVHAPTEGQCVQVGHNNFHYFWRIPTAEIENSTYQTATYDPMHIMGLVSGAFMTATQDEMYIITKTLMQECNRSDDGFRACVEACHNHALTGGRTMFDTATGGNYLSAYKDVFVKGTRNPGEPTAQRYSIVQDVLSGHHTIFYDGRYPARVEYWLGSGLTDIAWTSKEVFVGNYGGNNFFYIP